METNNMNPEQIDTIAELLGQNKSSNYCTLNAVGKCITAFIYVMIGRDFKGQTINYQCVVDALVELPSTTFDSLQALLLTINSEDVAKQHLVSKHGKLKREYDTMKEAIGDLQGIAQRNNFRAVMFEHLLLKNSPLGETIADEVQAEYSAKTVLEKEIGWMENRSRNY